MNRLARLLGIALVVFFVARSSAAFEPPAPSGSVTDTSGTLTAEEDARLEAEIGRYRAASGHQLGVLVLPSLGGENVEDVAYRTFNAWGVGRSGADDGVLLVLAIADRKMRIETGKGIGDRLTDVASHHILVDVIAPHLRAGHVAQGVEAGLNAIEHEIGGAGSPPAPAPAPASGPSDAGTIALVVVFVLVFALPVLFFWIVIRLVRKRGGSAGGTYTWTPSEGSSWSSDSSSSSSFSDSSSSSGGSDFGGGSSGGGGASDSW